MGSVWVLAFPFRYGPPKTRMNVLHVVCGLVVFCVVVVCSASLLCVLPPVYSLTWVCVFGGVFSVGRLVPVSSLNTSRCFHFWSIYPIIYWGPTQQLSLLLDA